MSIHTILREKKVFTLNESNEVIPVIRRITESTVEQVNLLTQRLDALPEDSSKFHEVGEKIDTHIRKWSEKVQKLGGEVKGLWLVDFDNGHGYYCWAWPEEVVDHFHGYDEGFSGRLRIC